MHAGGEMLVWLVLTAFVRLQGEGGRKRPPRTSPPEEAERSFTSIGRVPAILPPLFCKMPEGGDANDQPEKW